jgi:hypothetical protein
VGILLFGTPILLLLGYDFSFVLSVLLPISISINLLQIIKHYQYIDIKIVKNTLCYSIPFIILFLAIITTIHINISLIVGLFLLFVAATNFSTRINNKIATLVQYERSFLAITGIIHGISNLGGSLLTALSRGLKKLMPPLSPHNIKCPHITALKGCVVCGYCVHSGQPQGIAPMPVS